jgi:hypothetical protein
MEFIKITVRSRQPAACGRERWGGRDGAMAPTARRRFGQPLVVLVVEALELVELLAAA